MNQHMNFGVTVPLIAGGGADGDIFIGALTFGIHVIPLWEHTFHGSALSCEYPA